MLNTLLMLLSAVYSSISKFDTGWTCMNDRVLLMMFRFSIMPCDYEILNYTSRLCSLMAVGVCVCVRGEGCSPST